MAPSRGAASLYHVTFMASGAVALQENSTSVPNFTFLETGSSVMFGAAENAKGRSVRDWVVVSVVSGLTC